MVLEQNFIPLFEKFLMTPIKKSRVIYCPTLGLFEYLANLVTAYYMSGLVQYDTNGRTRITDL